MHKRFLGVRARVGVAFLLLLCLPGFYTKVWAGQVLPPAKAPVAKACVVVLHGMARTERSMRPIANYLRRAGYAVVNVDYSSRRGSLEPMAQRAVGGGVRDCLALSTGKTHFVTHSLGGILVRAYLAKHTVATLGRVVMLAPPNQGSEVVDKLKYMPGFKMLNGIVGRQLGTSPQDPPRALGRVNFELGVIAGTRSINLFLSTMLPDPDDGKVSLYSARVDGMCGFVAVPISHPFIMRRGVVHTQTLSFLRRGRFTGGSAERWPRQGAACDYVAPRKPGKPPGPDKDPSWLN